MTDDSRTDDPRTLVSTDWLAAHLHDPDLRIIDGSWHMEATGRDAHAEYMAAHIPGARFFDIDAIADTRSPLPHMAPQRKCSSAACAPWASATGIRWWSTTTRTSARRRGCGGPSG